MWCFKKGWTPWVCQTGHLPDKYTLSTAQKQGFGKELVLVLPVVTAAQASVLVTILY